MKLTVIGFWGGYPEIDGATSTYLLESYGSSILLDLGSAGLSKLQKYKNVEEIDAVVLSHFHTDHTADIGVLQHALLVRANVLGGVREIPIYAHREDEYEFSKLNHDYTKATEYNPKESLYIGPFKIDFFKTKHSVPCYGMRITDGESTIVYTADTAYDPKWSEFSKDADLLITDCNFYTGMNATAAGHMTSDESALIAKNAGASNLILSHLPQFGDLEQLKKEAEKVFDGKVILASEGLTWNNEFGFIS